MADKVDKILFRTMIMASNPKVTEAQINSLWNNYQSTGTLPKGFASLLPSKDNAKAPSCVFKPSEPSTNYSLGVEISAPQTQVTKIKPQAKTYSPIQEKSLRQDALNYLGTSTTEADKTFQKQLSENGVLGTMADGFKAMLNVPVKLATGDKYFTEERDASKLIADEKQGVQKLQNTKLEKGAFEFEFKKERGVDFNPENIEKFNVQSKQFLKVSAYKEKYDGLTSCIKELESDWVDSQKSNKYEASTFVTESKEKDFNAKLVKVLDKFCNGNVNLRNEYLKKLPTPEMKKGGFEANVMQSLKQVQAEAAKTYKKELGGKDFTTYENNYNNALKTAYGEKNSKAMSNAYMQSQKQGIMYTEMGLTIATTLLLPGSSLIAKGSATLAKEVGTVAAGQIVKGTFVAASGALPSGLHLLNAATSEAGVTDEAKAEAGQSLKMGLEFGAIGGYISAPLGELVGGLVKANPLVVSNAVSGVFSKLPTAAKVAGFATEVTADSFIQSMITDDKMSSALKVNGSMQAVMRMLTGGMAARAAEGYKVSESVVEGKKTYSVMDKSGKVLGQTTNPEELFAGVLGVIDKNTPKANSGEVSFTGKVEGGQKVKTVKATDLPKTAKAQEVVAHAETVLPLADKAEKAVNPFEQNANKEVNPFKTTKETPVKRVDVKEYLRTQTNYDKSAVDCMLPDLNKDNDSFVYEAIKTRKPNHLGDIHSAMLYVTNENMEYAIGILKNPNVTDANLSYVLKNANKDTIPEFTQLLQNKKFLKNGGAELLTHTNKDNISILKDFWERKDFIKNSNSLSRLLLNTNKDNINLAKDLISNNKTLNYDDCGVISNVLRNVNAENIEFANSIIPPKLEDIKQLTKDNYLNSLLSHTNKNNITLAKTLINNSNYTQKEVLKILDVCDIKTQRTPQHRAYAINEFGKLDNETKILITKCGINLDVVEYGLKQNKRLITTTKDQESSFLNNVIANNNISVESAIKNYNFTQHKESGLPLKYSRQDFENNIKNNLNGLTDSEKALVLSQFGLDEIKNGIVGIPNNHEFKNEYSSEKVNIAAKKIKQDIENFTIKNECKIDDKNVKPIIDGLIQGFPEFTSIIGKQNNNSSMEIQTLQSLQNGMKNPTFANLSDEGKTVFKFSTLLSDINGNTDAILNRYKLSESTKDRISNIVENKNTLAKFLDGKIDNEKLVSRFRNIEDYEIAESILKADSKYSGKFTENMHDKIMLTFDKMYSNQKFLFTSRLSKNGEPFPIQKVMIDGKATEVKALNFSELSEIEDLSKFGFSPGTTTKNARFIVHMVEDAKIEDLENLNSLLTNPNQHTTLSQSLVKAGDNDTFEGRKFGFILNNDNKNIAFADPQNMGSVAIKGTSTSNFEILFSEEFPRAKTFLKNRLMMYLKEDGLELNEQEYVQLAKSLQNKKHLTQIKDIELGDKIIKANTLVNALSKTQDALFLGDGHSEIVTFDPKIEALYAKVGKLEDCPPELIEFAKEKNLPIILVGNKKI